MIQTKTSEKTFKFWIPALIWLFVIFYFSNKPSLTIGSGGAESFAMRKFAHICEFGFLALFLLLPLIKKYKKKNLLIFLAVFLLTSFFALTDEFHQTFISGRNGNLKDVLVDSLGAFLFLQIWAFIWFTKKRIFLALSIFINLLAIFFLINFMIDELAQNNILSESESRQDIPQQQPISLEKENSDSDVIVDLKKEESLTNENLSINEQEIEIKQQNTIIPSKIILEVPFSSQAPLGVWDEVHEEACEEMSLIMVKYYLDKKDLSPKIAEAEIQKMKEYQLQKNGHFIDSSMEELSDIARDYFDLMDVSVKHDIIKEDIIKSLIQGYPVILPTAGRMLGNPNFSGLGPLYHNLVVIGFEGDEFITNDPGTRNGERYRYKIDVIMNAIHDYTGDKKEIEKGGKNGLIFVSN